MQILLKAKKDQILGLMQCIAVTWIQMGILKTFTERLLKLGRNYETYLALVEALRRNYSTSWEKNSDKRESSCIHKIV